MVWSQLDVTSAHVAYACIGVFSCVFSLISLYFKEKLYLGESTIAVIFGLIVGPHCLNWFDPTGWGNSDAITLEISRIVLCLQIFAVAVELPRKYMLKHWLSVVMLLVPVMTAGWLITGLFVWILIPGLNFADSLVVAACVTATDPILAQSVVSGKFAERVPGHLRNLLSAESGCNDGMAFPFIFLSLNIVFYKTDAGTIVKDWICISLLYECVFGCLLGVIIGYVGRRAIRYAEEKNFIDRESFLAFYVFLSFICAGFGSILGVDDLLVSFAAGTSFSWDGWFAQKTEESHVSTVIDLVLNLAYFVFFGAIIPWPQFNEASIGMTVWRPVVLAIVVIFLRRIPAVLITRPFIPDIKSWREAMFVGHFGPIGVGAIFASILARSELEYHATGEKSPLREIPPEGTEYWQLIAVIWPLVCFLVLTSIIVHGSSVAVFTLGRHLNTLTLSKSFTVHTTNGNAFTSKWMDRLPGLDSEGRSFSLHRVDTKHSGNINQALSRQSTIETNGVPTKPFSRKKLKKLKKTKKHGLRHRKIEEEGKTSLELEREQREREANAAAFALSRDEADLGTTSMINLEKSDLYEQSSNDYSSNSAAYAQEKQRFASITPKPTFMNNIIPFPSDRPDISTSDVASDSQYPEHEGHAEVAYKEGNKLIIENREGEVVREAEFLSNDERVGEGSLLSKVSSNNTLSSLKRAISPVNLRRSTLVDTENSKKYHAFKYGDALVIENDQGEIVRRYRVSTHDSNASEPGTRQRSNTMMSKALAVVGLGKSTSKTDSNENLESTAAHKQSLNKKISRQLTPLPPVPSTYTEEDDGAEDDEESLVQSELLSEEGSDTILTDDENNSDREEEEEEETAVERSRRLKALGISSAPRDRNDEEE